METKELIEGSLLVALVTVIIIIGFFTPILGSFLLLVSPLPIIAAVIRWNSRLGIIVSLLSGVILFILINASLLLFTIFYTGFLGVALGAAFAEEFKPKTILGIGTIVAASSFLLILFVIQYILHIDFLVQVKEQINLVAQTYQQIGVSNEVINQVSEQLLDTLTTTFPALMLSSGLLIAGLNYYFGIKVLTKLEFDYPYQLKAKEFKLSKIFIVIYLVSIFLSNYAVFENIYFLTIFLLFLEGAAVVYHYYLNDKISKLYLIVGLILFPIVLNLLFFVGLADLWFDFRNLDDA